MEKFATIKVVMTSNIPEYEPKEYLFPSAGDWLGEKFRQGTDFVVSPIIVVLERTITAIASTTMANLPMLFTLAGLVCFVLTIMFGKQKPYMWGIAFWGLSALVGVLNVELGIW